MAGPYKISALSALAVPAFGDLAVVVDVADTSTPPAGAGGSDQKATLGELLGITVWPSGDTSGTDDATAIAAAVTALGSSPGVVTLRATAPWYVAGGNVVMSHAGQFIDATGCAINAKGSGDTFRFFDASAGGGGAPGGGGLLGFPQIDGSGTTGKSYGVHLGDLLQGRCEAAALNFAATSDSAGFCFDNQWGGCEQLKADVYADGCSIAFLFTQNPAGGSTNCTGSFERGSMRFRADQEHIANQLFRADHGVYFTGSVWDAGGNAASAASGTAATAVYSVQGESPSGSADGAGNPSSMFDFTIYSCFEVEGGPVFPFTFLVDTTTNPGNPCFVDSLQGRLDFSGGAGTNFQQAGAFAVTNFVGTVFGDPSIVPQQANPQGFGSFASAQTVATSGTVAPKSSYWEVTSAANATGVGIAGGGADGQMLTLLNTGSHTVALTTTPAVTLQANGTSGDLHTFWWSASQSKWYG